MKRLLLSAVCAIMVYAGSAQSATCSFSVDRWKSKITQLNIQILDGKSATLSRELRDEKFEDLFTVRKGTDRVQLMTRDGKDGLREVVFLAESKDGGLYIRCTGKFSQRDLDQMTKALQDKDDQ